MYIKRAYMRMKKMQKSTWRFFSMCFVLAYLYLFAAIIMLVANDLNGNVVLIRNALEIASFSQSVLLICAIGSVIIEEITLGR